MRGKGKNKDRRYSLTPLLMRCLGGEITLFPLSSHYVINFYVYFQCKGHVVGLMIQGRCIFFHITQKPAFFNKTQDLI